MTAADSLSRLGEEGARALVTHLSSADPMVRRSCESDVFIIVSIFTRFRVPGLVPFDRMHDNPGYSEVLMRPELRCCFYGHQIHFGMQKL